MGSRSAFRWILITVHGDFGIRLRQITTVVYRADAPRPHPPSGAFRALPGSPAPLVPHSAHLRGVPREPIEGDHLGSAGESAEEGHAGYEGECVQQDVGGAEDVGSAEGSDEEGPVGGVRDDEGDEEGEGGQGGEEGGGQEGVCVGLAGVQDARMGWVTMGSGEARADAVG